jgi:4-alpha-glucanotransferase
MRFERAAGILLHPTSLPGPYGIGDLGPAAHQFVDWLAGSGCRLWQVLPLGPTGYGDSPYQCFSSIAGNPYLISPDFLLRENFLHPNDLKEQPDLPSERVDYSRVIPWKLNLLERAYNRFRSDPGGTQAAYEGFCAENSSWLPDYTMFMALKEAHGYRPWWEWPAVLRGRKPDALADVGRRHADAVARYQFYQFVFSLQWGELREHAHKRDLRIIGDLPIFVAHDSADVWANPELFFLDEEGQPRVIAGVPPDYFSKTGQLWGNPLYDWQVHRASGYAWWISRLRSALEQVDVLRLDHFRGFAGYWEIPVGSATAERGQWVSGPGRDFFRRAVDELGDLPLIAEDLGEITPDVIELRDEFGFPGMKILQFGFTGPEDPFLPHNFPGHCVVYTGTHDNDTALGWFRSAPVEEREFACKYLDTDESNFAWDLVRAGWASMAVYAIAPMQDILGLGTEARMNYPSTLGGNWVWRLRERNLSKKLQKKIRSINHLYGR